MSVVFLTQRVVTTAGGERRDCLDQRWTRLLEPMGCQALPLPNQLVAVERYLEVFHPGLVILTGGNDIAALKEARDPAPERDALEHRLLDRCQGMGIPVLGVCRGMQIMAVHHGAGLLPVPGHAGRSHSVMVGKPPPRWWEQGDVIVGSYHDYGVDPRGLPPGISAWAHSPDGHIEGIAAPGYRQVGVMWHPEREADPEPGRGLIAALLRGGAP